MYGKKLVILALLAILLAGLIIYEYYQSTKPLRGKSYVHYVPSESDKIVCIYFDDGWKSQMNVTSYLDGYGYKVTLSVVVNYTTNKFPAYLTWDQIMSLSDKGYDIQCHSLSHENLTTQSQSDLELEIVYRKQVFLSHGFVVSTFVYPFGYGYDNTTVRKIVEANYSNARTISIFTNETTWNLNADKYAISGFVLTNSTSFQEFTQLVVQAKGNTVVILVYHDFDTGREYSITSQQFAEQLAYLHEHGIKVKLLNELVP